MFRRLALVSIVAGAVVLSGCSVFFGSGQDAMVVERPLRESGLPVTEVKSYLTADGFTENLMLHVYLDQDYVDADTLRKTLEAVNQTDLDYVFLRLSFFDSQGNRMKITEGHLTDLGINVKNISGSKLEIMKGDFARFQAPLQAPSRE